MLHYIIQTVAFQLLFLIIFDVFLKKETFFNYNRVYLLVASVLSLMLPFIKIESFKQILPQNYILALPEVFLGDREESTLAAQQTQEVVSTATNSLTFSWEHVLYLGCGIALTVFIYKLSKILFVIYNNPKSRHNNVSIVSLKNNSLAFSFFNYIFLGDKIKIEEKESIIAHEQVHIRHKHSIDLLFFEVLRILFWFNPLVYVYQKRMANMHEFIADAEVIKHNDKSTYYEKLLSQIFDTQTVSFINPFFKQSLIKKRIIMLSKSKSKQSNLLKYLILIPVVVGMLFYTSCDSQIEASNNETTELTEQELYNKISKEYDGLTAKEIFKKVTQSVSGNENNYLNTLEQYVEMKVRIVQLQLTMLEKNKLENDVDRISSIKERIKKVKEETYENYLEKKKSQKSIDNWQNGGNNDVIRKHVKDLDNITASEQKIIDGQLQQIENDEWYHTLIISDGLRHKKIQVEKEKKVINNVNVSGTSQSTTIEEAISFAVIDQVPIYPGCDGTADEKECMSININKFVGKNFNIKLAESLKLSGVQKINSFFTIDKNGEIVNIKVRAPHQELEKETRRVINMLPKLRPGEQDGKPVNVSFFLPIKFKVKE